MAPLVLVVAMRIATMGDALTNDEAGSAVVGRSWLRGDGPGVDPGAYGAYWFDRPPLLPLAYGIADLLGGATGVRLLGMLTALVLVALIGCIARTLGDARTAHASRWIAAPLLVAAPMQADRTYGELLAAVPAAFAVWMLARICARETGSVLRDAALAGVGASCAVLFKQSALDAALVAAVLLAGGRIPWRAAVAGGAGLIAPLGATAAWSLTRPGGPAALLEATVGFRLEQLGSSGAADAEPIIGVTRLALPMVLSGLVLVVPLALLGMVRVRRDWRGILLGAWIAGSLLGIVGGGFYWPHYLIQLVAPVAVAAAVWVSTSRRSSTGLRIGCTALVVLAIAGPAVRHQVAHTGRLDGVARDVGEDVRDRAAAGDRILVLGARPGVVHASGLRSASPWLWSAMVDTRPGVDDEFTRLLEAANPPRWVVSWDRSARVDPAHAARLRRLLEARYERVGTHDGRGIWQLRTGRNSSRRIVAEL